MPPAFTAMAAGFATTEEPPPERSPKDLVQGGSLANGLGPLLQQPALVHLTFLHQSYHYIVLILCASRDSEPKGMAIPVGGTAWFQHIRRTSMGADNLVACLQLHNPARNTSG